MTLHRCHDCGSPLAVGQQWCVVCGARLAGARTDAQTLLFGERAAPAAAAPPPSGGSLLSHSSSDRPLLTAGRRRRAALPVALASLVGLVVVTGTSVPASLAGMSQPPFTVVLPAQVAAQVAQAPPAEEPAPLDDTYAEAPLDETPVEEAPVEVADTPAAEQPADETPAAEDPAPQETTDSSPVRHVFLIVLGSTDVAALAQDATAAPYLAGTLAKSGTLLSDYRTIGRGSLANRIALVSGQGPTQQTLADCTTYADVRPADALAGGQTGGDGCVYGYETGTIGDQLRALERTWKAYVEPAAGAARATAAAAPPRARAAAACATDAATTRRNPFLWFRGTSEADDCDQRNVPLTQLERDLKDSATTPALSYVASDAQQGSAEADRFLERVVPQILNSLAYANGGLIVITSDQPPAAPATPTPPAATTPAPAPPAATTPAPTTPVDPPAATTPQDPPPSTTPADAPPATTPQDPPPTTTPTTPANPPAAAPTTTPAPGPLARAATPAATGDASPGPATYANVGDAAAAGAGLPVGALLISSFTPAGRVDGTPANAFTLLRTLSQIFGVDPLGYAAGDEVEPLPDELFSVTP